MPKFTYPRDVAAAIRGSEHLLLLAPEAVMKKGWLKRLPDFAGRDALNSAVASGTATSEGRPVTTLGDRDSTVTAVLLPDNVSRHNSPTRHEAIRASVRRAALMSVKKATVICAVDSDKHIGAVINAIGRALPEFQRKTGGSKGDLAVRLVVTNSTGAVHLTG